MISERKPDLLVVKDSAHPVPDLIVRMHQRRNLRNRTMASAQVYLSRDIRVGSRPPSQPKPGIHPPIVAQSAVMLQRAPPEAYSSSRRPDVFRHRDWRPSPGSTSGHFLKPLQGQPFSGPYRQGR